MMVDQLFSDGLVELVYYNIMLIWWYDSLDFASNHAFSYYVINSLRSSHTEFIFRLTLPLMRPQQIILRMRSSHAFTVQKMNPED